MWPTGASCWITARPSAERTTRIRGRFLWKLDTGSDSDDARSVVSTRGSFCVPRFQAEFHVQAEALNPDRPAIPVERRVGDALQIEGRDETGNQPGAVIAFPNVFRRVVELAVANQEVQSAARQVERMHTRDAAGSERSGGDVILPVPARSFQGDSAAGQAVDNSEG